MNGDKSITSEAEFSDYQKEIDSTENVILCVAKAEKMIREIGASLTQATCTTDDRPVLRSEEMDRDSA
jgi:hypothetical protein